MSLEFLGSSVELERLVAEEIDAVDNISWDLLFHTLIHECKDKFSKEMVLRN